MPAFLSVQPQTLIPSPFAVRTRDFHPFRRKSQYLSRSNVRVGDSAVVKFGLQHSFPDPEFAQGLVKEVFDRAESVIYTIADAAVSSDSTNVSKQSGDWLSGITSYLESVLKVLKDGLSALHVPYSYGFAIILLTILVKAATFPLTKKQVESTMAVRSLQPQIQAIQKRYDGDKERIQLETARLYKLAGVNPLAGCLPTLATIPIWIGLYRALSNVADEGLLTEGFFWIPTLSGPTTVAARQSGSGISWLFPFVDGHPPLGWSDTLAYLVLPVLLVLSQYISLQIMQSSQINDPNQKNSQALTKFLPLMIGYFALSVPSGLSLYWFTNNILSTAQQVWLQKLGGAQNPVLQKSIPELETRHVERNSNPVPQKSIPEVESRQIENSASGGIRPGERFKQLKEQEARIRQQREEEKRKAEEAAKAVDMGNGENKQEPESAIAKNETAKVNGAYSIQELDKETTKEAYPTNGGVASAKGAASKDAQGSFNNHKKDETVEH